MGVKNDSDGINWFGFFAIGFWFDSSTFKILFKTDGLIIEQMKNEK